MQNLLQVIQVILALLMTGLVLIQSKSGGFASGIGNQIGFYRSRRGLEKVVFVFTIITAILLVANSLFLVILN